MAAVNTCDGCGVGSCNGACVVDVCRCGGGYLCVACDVSNDEYDAAFEAASAQWEETRGQQPRACQSIDCTGCITTAGESWCDRCLCDMRS